MTLVHILRFALPVVIVMATLEALVLAVVMRRSYNWRAKAGTSPDATQDEALCELAWQTFNVVRDTVPQTPLASWKRRGRY
jgi:hypothetical protein